MHGEGYGRRTTTKEKKKEKMFTDLHFLHGN
jgi:hypothetical protein